MKDSSIMGFLFQKPSRGKTRTPGLASRRKALGIQPAEVRNTTMPPTNTFEIPVSDTGALTPARQASKPDPEPNPEPEVERDVAPVSAAEPDPNLENASELVHQIREALVPQGDFLSIPAEAVLAHLPEELRGPCWPGKKSTGISLMLEREPLLQKLRTGSICYRLGEFLPDLPDGWAVDEPAVEVKLDLPTVVNALPLDVFGPDPAAPSVVSADPGGRDYFAPAHPSDAEAEPEPKPEPEVAAASVEPPSELTADATRRAAHLFGSGKGPKRQVVPTHIPGAWNGVEAPCAASLGAVDINVAGLDELQALPGVGPERARMILNDRMRGGPFDGIYDLLRIRGIGRKRFCRLTGLTLRRRDRRDRHEALNELIGLPVDSRPGLPEIVGQIAVTLQGAGCTLVAPDGGLLASSTSPEQGAELRAAIVPMLFRRTGRYLKDLAPGASSCVALPLSDPPLLIFAIDHFFLMLEAADSVNMEQIMSPALVIAKELIWLLAPRAMVCQAPPLPSRDYASD